MSLSFCDTCERVVEGKTHTVREHCGNKEYVEYEACNVCKDEVSEITEHDPGEVR
jgi:hypothetical protein